MAFFASVLFGLGAAKLGIVMSFGGVLAAGCVAVISSHKRRPYAWVVVCLVGVLLGTWRGQDYRAKMRLYTQLYGQIVTVQLTAQSDGAHDDSQLAFDAEDIVFTKPYTAHVPGRVSIKGLAIPAVFRGDRLEVTGKLYKTRGSKQAGISYADVRLLSRKTTVFDRFRLWFSSGVRNAVPEPQASFGIGLLIGQRTALPPAFTDTLSKVGLTHIIAVSGYNLTIIIEFARSKLGKRSKYQALVWSIMLMGGFVLVTGFSASIIRATIVSTLSLAAWYYGRTIRPLLLILFAAGVTALWNPLYIWSDVGWYLSFLAFFGVLIIAPLVIASRKQQGKRATALSVLVIESFCAQIMTLPIIMFIFHRLAIIGLVSNIIVVPLVPLAMVCTLFAGLAGMLSPALSGWFGLPAKLVLQYMMDAASLFARWSHATINHVIDAITMIMLYACMIAAAVILWRRVRKNATITDRNTTEDA